MCQTMKRGTTADLKEVHGERAALAFKMVMNFADSHSQLSHCYEHVQHGVLAEHKCPGIIPSIRLNARHVTQPPCCCLSVKWG